MKAAAIIVAGGSGKRFGSKIPKQFLKLNGKPVFLHSVEAFASLKAFKQIIVVTPKQYVNFVKKYLKQCSEVVIPERIYRESAVNPLKSIPHSSLLIPNFAVTAGGKKRFDSVRNGLKIIDKSIDFIAIHDAARPLISKQDILAVLKKAVENRAAVAAEKTKDTIKTVQNGFVKNTLDRKLLWNVQTPQIFEASLLKKAYSKKIAANTTDDSMLIEKSGVKVAAVETKFPNFKITTQQDFEMAKLLL